MALGHTTVMEDRRPNTKPVSQFKQPERRVTDMPSPKTRILSPRTADLETAAAILRAGRLVAFPTETVYGLGADARCEVAVSRIFSAKGRPGFNPLIAHVKDADAAQKHVVWSDMATQLAEAFWPGPLTLVLPLRDGHDIAARVRADLPTLAVRVPRHPAAQGLLRAFDGPLAAPSANPSGRISPTTASHVLSGLKDRIDAVIDAGPCSVGLESTIIGLGDDLPKLLRPGGVSLDSIENVLGRKLIHRNEADTLSAPGQLLSHYAPAAGVRLNATIRRPGEALLGFGSMDCDLNLSIGGDLNEAAANLFDYLRRLDKPGRTIAVALIPNEGLGVAINDRLTRAAAPRDA